MLLVEAYRYLRMPRLKSFLHFFSLETGAKVVALLHLVFIGGIFIIDLVETIMMEYRWYKRHDATFHEEYYSFSNAFVRDEFGLTLGLSEILFSLVLFLGVVKKDKAMFIPWIFMQSILFISVSLSLVQSINSRVLQGKKRTAVFLLITIWGLEGYFISIVNSFYKELKQNENTDD